MQYADELFQNLGMCNPTKKINLFMIKMTMVT